MTRISRNSKSLITFSNSTRYERTIRGKMKKKKTAIFVNRYRNVRQSRSCARYLSWLGTMGCANRHLSVWCVILVKARRNVGIRCRGGCTRFSTRGSLIIEWRELQFKSNGWISRCIVQYKDRNSTY